MRKPSAVRTWHDAIRLGTCEAAHVGVEVHKATYHVAVLSTERGFLATWVQPARPEILIGRLRPIRA